MQTSRNPFAYPGHITLDTLDDLFAHHRGLSGGWSMKDDGGDGGDDGRDGGTGGDEGGDSGGEGRQNATDTQGNDLGYPKDTPTAEMSDKEQAAYWKHKSRKHEGRLSDFLGDRDPADVKKDLDEIAKIRREQQTPAEQALTDAREQGKSEGIASERSKAATAIFRGALEAAGVKDDDLDEIASNFNVAAYVSDDGIDTKKITNFAKRFGQSDRDNNHDQQRRRRDYGGGDRGGSGGRSTGGSVKQVMEERRAAREERAAAKNN